MKEIAKKIGLLFIAMVNVLCLLLVVEWSLTDERQRDLTSIRNRLIAEAHGSGREFDRRSKLDLVRDLRAKGQPAYPTFAPGLERGGIVLGHELYPLSGISNTTTVFCNENGAWTVYTSDEHGFNNPPGLWRSGATDVAVIGDSFVHGGCVGAGEDIAAQLRSHGVHALNLGIASTGPLAYLATLTEYAEPLRPRRVFLVFFAGDLRQLPSEYDGSPRFRRYLESTGFSQHLINQQPLIDSLVKRYMDQEYDRETAFKPSHRLVGRLRGAYSSLGHMAAFSNVRGRIRCLGRCVVQEPDAARKLQLFDRIITAARDKVRAWGGELVVVYVPDWYSYGRSYDSAGVKTDTNYLLRKDVLRIAAERGVRTIDAQALVFDASGDPLSLFNFRTYGHYNREGYAAIAAQVVLFIKRDTTASLRRGVP